MDDNFEELRKSMGDLDPGYDYEGRIRPVVDALITLMPPDMRRRARELRARYPDTDPEVNWLHAEPDDHIGYYVGPEDARVRLCGFHVSEMLGDDA